MIELISPFAESITLVFPKLNVRISQDILVLLGEILINIRIIGEPAVLPKLVQNVRGYDCYSYAMRGIKRVADANTGLKKVGCNNVYKLFDTAYKKVFARFENDDRIKSYEDIVQYLTEKDEKILEKTYENFDEKLGPLLCERAYEFYRNKLNKSV